MIQAGVIGASGYAGGEVVRILVGHPEIEITYLASDTYAGQPLSNAFRSLLGAELPVCEKLDPSVAAERADVLFLAQHNGWAMEVAPSLLQAGKKLIDLSADFRFSDSRIYEEWYKIPHKSPDLCKEAVYGIPELHKEQIAKASLVANPGCYPTGAILAMAPLVKHGVVDASAIIVDAKSGVSGAGRSKFELGNLYSEANENIKPYNVGDHRHTPEIEQELSALAGAKLVVSFTPHLTPMTRGILATSYAPLKSQVDTAELLEISREFYKNAPFVVILPENEYPATKNTAGSNYCHIGYKVDGRTNRVVAMSAIDNLIKGAAGQAVQNINVMMGLDERIGLETPGLYP